MTAHLDEVPVCHDVLCRKVYQIRNLGYDVSFLSRRDKCRLQRRKVTFLHFKIIPNTDLEDHGSAALRVLIEKPQLKSKLHGDVLKVIVTPFRSLHPQLWVGRDKEKTYYNSHKVTI